MDKRIKFTLLLFTIILVLLVVSSFGLFILFPTNGMQYLGYSVTVTPITALIVLFIVLISPNEVKKWEL